MLCSKLVFFVCACESDRHQLSLIWIWKIVKFFNNKSQEAKKLMDENLKVVWAHELNFQLKG